MKKVAILTILVAVAVGPYLAAHEQAGKLAVATRLAVIPEAVKEAVQETQLKSAVVLWGSSTCPPQTTETYWVAELCEGGIRACKQDYAVTNELRLELLTIVPRTFQLVCVEVSREESGDPYDCLPCSGD